jgi:hypothetical protein
MALFEQDVSAAPVDNHATDVPHRFALVIVDDFPDGSAHYLLLFFLFLGCGRKNPLGDFAFETPIEVFIMVRKNRFVFVGKNLIGPTFHPNKGSII